MQEFLDLLYSDQAPPTSSQLLSLETADDRLFSWLIEHQDVLSQVDAFLMSPIHHLVTAQKINLFLRLAEKFPDLMKQRDLSGKTVLHFAVLTRSPEVIYKVVPAAKELLITPDSVGKSPLELLLERHEFEVFLDVLNMYWLEIDEAQLKESSFIASLKHFYFSLQSFILNEAIEKGNLRYLVDAREWALMWLQKDLEMLDELQFSILMQAVQQSSYANFVKILNESVLDINFTNNQGQNALHMLFQGTFPDPISKMQALIEKKIEISAVDSKGRTCLHAILDSKLSDDIKREAFEILPQNTIKFRRCLRLITKDGFGVLSLGAGSGDIQLMSSIIDAYKLHFPAVKAKNYLNYPEYLSDCVNDSGGIIVPYQGWNISNSPHLAVRPLETAFIRQDAELVSLLMASGASINIFSKMNEPLLSTLLSTGNTGLLSRTLQSIPSTSRLHLYFKVNSSGVIKSSSVYPQLDLSSEILTIFGRIHEAKAEMVKLLVDWLFASEGYSKSYSKLFMSQKQSLTSVHKIKILQEVILADKADILIALLPPDLEEETFNSFYVHAFDLSIALSRPNCFRALQNPKSNDILRDPCRHISHDLLKSLEIYHSVRVQIEGVPIPTFYDYSFLIYSLRTEVPCLEIIKALFDVGAHKYCENAIENFEVCLFYELFRFNRSRQLPGKSVSKALNELNSNLPEIVNYLLKWLLGKLVVNISYSRQVLAAVEVCSSLSGFKVFMSNSYWHIYPFIRNGYWSVLSTLLYHPDAPLFGVCLRLPADNKLFAKTTSKLIKNLTLAKHFDLLSELLCQMQRHVTLLLPEEPVILQDLPDDLSLIQDNPLEELPSMVEFQSMDDSDDFIVLSDTSYSSYK
mmetsp:Transcript_22518/g.40569  ORF Transcript_22518/g.40569 Transcript_22518/m.40569 type:complete len:860 (-) Transcript_22518:4435-7014(-)